MTTFIVTAVIVLAVLAVAVYVIRQKNRGANIARADELRTQAATEARSTLPSAQDRAAEAEARADEARAAAARAEAQAEEARVAAAQAEAEHESQVRAADVLDPRVKHRADDYEPQVGGTVDQQPTGPSEANRTQEQAPDPTPDPTPDPAPEGAGEAPAGDTLLPRRTPGANEMPGKPIESHGKSGGWFTRKDSDQA